MKKKIILAIGLIVCLFSLMACDKSWHKTIGNTTEFGGTINDNDYKCIIKLFPESDESQVKTFIRGKVSIENYDIAMGVYQDGSEVKFPINYSLEKFSEDEMQSMLNKIIRIVEAKGTFKVDDCKETIIDFLKAKYK